MKVVCYDSMDALPSSYDALFEHQETLGFDQTKEWYQAFIEEALDPTSIPLLFGIEEESQNPHSLALLPMCYQQETALSFLLPRQLRSLTNYYSSIFSPILDASQSRQSEILHLFFEHIARETPAWHVFDIEPLDKDDSLFNDIRNAISANGMFNIPYFRFGNWYLELEGRNFTEYFESLPPTLKNTLKRKSKKLFSANSAHVDIITGTDGLDTALEHFERIYKSSWKVAEPYPKFIRRIAQEFAKQGYLRLGVLYVNQEPAAAQIWFLKGKVASIFKLAYDPTFRKQSVGSILTMKLMQHVIDTDGVETVDYLVGDDRYKKDWMSHRRERWGIMAFNARTPKGAIAAARHISSRKIKEYIQFITKK
jgi:ribosomal protein S18 acetylase RimI-like enzyme